MLLDPAAYLRLEALNALGSTSTGVSFATSTGDLLEITAYGGGTFRLRLGPNARPDYGLVVGRAKPCTVAQPAAGMWTIASDDAVLEITASPLRFRLLWKGAPLLTSITDEHFRGWTRLPSFGRVKRGGLWTAAFALASGEPVYGLGEKFGPLNKRGQLIHSQVEDALGVNTGLSHKNTPFAWGPGTGSGAWGTWLHTPGMVTHGVGHPDWSHRSYAVVVDDEAIDLFLFAADTPAGILDAYANITGRAPSVPRWSLGLWMSRHFYTTPAEAIAVAAKLRERRIPCDVLTLDGRAAWDVQTRFNFQWDPERFPDPAATLAEIRAHHLKVCVWEYPYVSIHDKLFQQLAQRGYLLKTADGDPYVFFWDAATQLRTNGNTPAPLPESGIVDFTHPEAYAWWRDAHKKLFKDGVDVMLCDYGEQVPDDAVAANGDRGRRLHNVYPLLYNKCVFEATRKFLPAELDPDGLGPRRLGRQPALSDGLGRAAAKRLGRTRRQPARRPVVGDERQSVPQLGHRRVLRVRAAIRRTLRALAAGDGVLLACPHARHRRARALGLRPGNGGDLPQVARLQVPAHSLSRNGHRAGHATGLAGHARDAARVSRETRWCGISKRSSCAATRCSWRPSCATAATSRSRCRRATGTTSTPASASRAGR